MWLWSVHSCFQWYKNYKNRPRNARVVVKNNVASFFPDTVYSILLRFQRYTNLLRTYLTGTVCDEKIKIDQEMREL